VEIGAELEEEVVVSIKPTPAWRIENLYTLKMMHLFSSGRLKGFTIGTAPIVGVNSCGKPNHGPARRGVGGAGGSSRSSSASADLVDCSVGSSSRCNRRPDDDDEDGDAAGDDDDDDCEVPFTGSSIMRMMLPLLRSGVIIQTGLERLEASVGWCRRGGGGVTRRR
jgi:hypothetical protein